MGDPYNSRRESPKALRAIETRQLAIEALGQKAASIDDSSEAANVRIMPQITGDQIIRLCGESAFEEPIVVLIAGGVDSHRGLIPDRDALESG